MKATNALRDVSAIIDTLAPIQKMTDVGGDKAALALATVSAALGAVIKGLDGSATAQEVLADVEAQIKKLRVELAANDAAADSALDAKFKGGV